MSSKTESKELEKRVLEFLCNQTQKFLFIDCSNSGLNGNEIFGVIQGLKVEESAENSAKRRKIELPQRNYLGRENQAFYKWNHENLEEAISKSPNLLLLELPGEEDIDRDRVKKILDLVDRYLLKKMILVSKKEDFFEDLFYWYHKAGMLKLKKPQPDFFPIHIIVDEGALTDIITYLVRKGADINQQNGNKDTPLHLAVENRRIDLVRHLLSLGADVNLRNKENQTVLHVALKKNSLGIANIILTKNVDVNLKDNKGYTALHLAAGLGNVDIMKQLVEKGAEINTKNNLYCTPLMYACEGGKDAVEYLLPLVKDVDIQKTFMHAVKTDNVDVIDILVRRDADVNFECNKGLTPLHSAAYYGNLNTVNALLKYGADPSKSSIHYDTPLYSAVSKRHKEIVQKLLEAGSRVDYISRTFAGYKNIIHTAAQKADKDILLILLEKKADALIQDTYGNTALHYAALNDCTGIIDVLIVQGLDINAKNRYGKTALFLACQYNRPNVVRCLISHKADVNIKEGQRLQRSPLHRACEEGNLDVVRVLLDAGANINGVTTFKDTPLHFAVRKGDEEIVAELLEKDADVTAVNCKDETALNIAQRHHSKKIIELFSKKTEEH